MEIVFPSFFWKLVENALPLRFGVCLATPSLGVGSGSCFRLRGIFPCGLILGRRHILLLKPRQRRFFLDGLAGWLVMIRAFVRVQVSSLRSCFLCRRGVGARSSFLWIFDLGLIFLPFIFSSLFLTVLARELAFDLRFFENTTWSILYIGIDN